MKMFGSASKFFLRNLGGIQAAAPGYKQAKIQPAVVGDLKWVRSAQNSVSGRYEVDWKRGDDALDMKVAIPAGTTARVHVPTLDFKGVKITDGAKTIWQDGKFTSGVPGITAAEKAKDAIVFDVGSGKYEFKATGSK
jgi:alpha-L-rhamnosidase